MKKKLGVFAEDAVFSENPKWGEVEDYYDLEYFGVLRSGSSPDQLIDAYRSVEVAVFGRKSAKMPVELAHDLGNLRYACHGFGTIRHLIPKVFLERGLIVTNWGDSVSNVAEGAIGLILCLLLQLLELDRWSVAGEKNFFPHHFPSTLRGRDVGLYGYGPIGQHAGRMLHGFGARVAIYDPFARDVPDSIRRCQTLEELFGSCQVISIHCGLNDATRGSVGKELLELLPQGGIVVNTARGAIIKEKELADFVRQKKIMAGLDVIEHEKTWEQSPLAGLPGSLLTRHKVSTDENGAPAPFKGIPGHMTANLVAYAKGEPLTGLITAEQYDLKS